MMENGLRRVVVATDFSRAASAASTFARDLAEHLDSELHLLHVHATHEHHPFQRLLAGLRDSGHSVPSMEEQALDLLEEGRAELKGVGALAAYREGEDLAGTILAYAREVDADLIIVGRRAHRALPNFTSGTLGVRLAGDGSRAVLVVPEERYGRIRHIGVPVDFSDSARNVIRGARWLADAYGARLSLVYVAERRVVPVFQDTGLFSIEVLEPDPGITARAHEALVQFYDGTQGPNVNVSFEVREGDAEAQLLEFVDAAGVDLIMMPPHGLTGAPGLSLRRSGLGRTSERMIRRAHCPVVVTPEHRT